MKFWLISDNHDTLVGMRLAGIEGVVCDDAQGTESALDKALKNPEIGIILITKKLSALCRETVDDIKLCREEPLIVEIPDRHADGSGDDTISKYITEAIGVKI